MTKVYGSGDAATTALGGVWLTVERGSFTAIMGPSGSGKTTLLQIIAGLDRPTAGKVFLGNEEVSAMNEAGLTRIRRREIGFIFQAHNLLPTLTTQENILLPLVIAGERPDFGWFHQVVGAVGLEKRLSHRPFELSQGQQQRVATARALITRPKLVLADEPTGNLDSRASTDLLTFLSETMKGFSQTVVMVTHDHEVAIYAERIVSISDGVVVGDWRGDRRGAEADRRQKERRSMDRSGEETADEAIDPSREAPEEGRDVAVSRSAGPAQPQ